VASEEDDDALEAELKEALKAKEAAKGVAAAGKKINLKVEKRKKNGKSENRSSVHG